MFSLYYMSKRNIKLPHHSNLNLTNVIWNLNCQCVSVVVCRLSKCDSSYLWLVQHNTYILCKFFNFYFINVCVYFELPAAINEYVWLSSLNFGTMFDIVLLYVFGWNRVCPKIPPGTSVAWLLVTSDLILLIYIKTI